MSRTMLDRAGILAATGHHPYVRFVAGASRDLAGLAVDDAVLWRCVGPFGPYAHALGSPAAVARAVAAATDAGLLDDARWANLPGGSAVPPGWVERELWDYRWLPGTLSQAFNTAKVRPVAGDDAVAALLDEAYPHAELRPGHPMVRQWYGIAVDGRLVACAADRTTPALEPDAVPTGVIGGVAVHPAHRGRGLGGVVTAAVAAALLAAHDQVGLGVTVGNDAATRVYERLGFTGVHRLLSIRPAG